VERQIARTKLLPAELAEADLALEETPARSGD
jgi:hypothetical protein